MAIEIERKWLVNKLEPWFYDRTFKDIRNITVFHLTDSHRISQSVGRKKSTWYSTVKSTEPLLSRVEIDLAISSIDYNDMVSTMPGLKPIKKTRYEWIENDKFWEFDRFDNGLLLLELELETEQEQFILPTGLVIDKEVTGVAAYYGYNIFRSINASL